MTWKIKATSPPPLKKTYASAILWTLAVIIILFAVAHLIRIDKLIPVVAESLSGMGATWFVALVVIAEVFAVPYLLQLRLSPLMRVISGLLVVLAPLAWTCFTIWAWGNDNSTGQFTSYVSTPASWWVIVLDIVWLGASYWALWLSNFDKACRVLKKTK